MTKEKIKEALRCCKNQCCSSCPHWCEIGCEYQTLSDALDLITEQEKENDLLKMQLEDAVNHANTFLEEANKFEAENKKLKAENKMRLINLHTALDDIKQAKIDVLKELKTRHDYAIKNMGYPWDISQQIDELIKEIENG